MGTQQFRSINFKAKARERIKQAQEILDEYDQKLTARQVYYQFVSRGLLENNVKNYKNLTVLLTDARYAGIIDWEAIEDRGREPNTPSEWQNLEDLMDSALKAYRLPRWRDQPHYVELWVEKQALAGILQPLARKYHVTLMVNKGYSSASAMYDASQRMIEACGGWEASSRTPILFYLGDHDPSGEDMVRDIHERLTEFGVMDLETRKLALNMPQIKQWSPPPNPAKITDSRAKAYIEKYGEESWELDALPPRELTRLIEAAFRTVVDMNLMERVIAQEEEDKSLLRKAVKAIREAD